MLGKRTLGIMAGVLTLAVSSGAFAGVETGNADMEAMRQEMANLRNEVAQLRAEKGETWLTERRAEEVKALVRDVLADAETRASLLDSGMMAGHNGKSFFLASDDGNFLMKIGGQWQFRYILNERGGIDGTVANKVDGNEEGFQLRRAKVWFTGHAYDPKLTYKLRLQTGNGNNVTLEVGWIAYEVADGVTVRAGQFYPMFTHDEGVSSSKQQAVERSITSDFFTIDYTQGVALEYAGEMGGVPVEAGLTIHDGTAERGTDFNADMVDCAIAGRIQAALMGKMSQFKDYATWSGDEMGLLVGAGFDYEAAEHASGDGQNTDIFKWTVDASLEMPELAQSNIALAVFGMHTDNYGTTPGADAADQDMYGLLLQGGLFVIPDKVDVFARYEYMDLDDQSTPGLPDQINILTFGTNYYIKKHNVKATFDIICVLDKMDAAVIGNQTGHGILTDSARGQVAGRAQVQFLF